MKIELIANTPNPELTIAEAARICYNSTPSTLEHERTFIRGLVKAGHTAVIEHASATFRFSEVSRSLTHQLVRHRLFSFCQRSQRYVKEDKFGYVIPPSITADENALKKYKETMEIVKDAYQSFITDYKIKPEDARFVLPNSCNTMITVSGNFREWHSFLDLRLDSHAQWEIRALAHEVFKMLYQLAPSVFEDLKVKYDVKI